MDRWLKTDVTGKLRAQKLLEPCARLVRHGHKDEALGKIAGAMVLGFIAPSDVAKELKVSADKVNAAAETYRQKYKETK